MPNKTEINKSDSVLAVKRVHFPEKVSEWIFEESSNVFEGSPFLGHISWLSGCLHEFSEVTISFLCQGSVKVY